jgi:transposase-like protein
MSKIAKDRSRIVAELPTACQDEKAAVEFLERQRWPVNPVCPRCQSGSVYQMQDRKTGERNRRFLWLCKGCGKQFTVRVGTVFEDSKIPLRHWCYGFWAACASKKGVSALQIKRMTGLSYKSALFMMHRIRFAMADTVYEPTPLLGTVEADETFIGGKPRFVGHGKPNRVSKKAVVLAMVERNGRVRPKHMARLGGKAITDTIRREVHSSARLITDDATRFRPMSQTFRGGHETVMHSAREYARGDVHTNTVEGFFALLKRGIVGTYHSVSRKHLHRYLSEFAFRYNARHIEDGARTSLAIKSAVGKRLLYRDPYESSQHVTQV